MGVRVGDGADFIRRVMMTRDILLQPIPVALLVCIVALDSTRNLLETFSGLYLKLRLDRPALLGGNSWQVLSQDGDLFTLRLNDFIELEGVLARLRETGVTIKEFELQPPDLEEVFMRIMSREE